MIVKAAEAANRLNCHQCSDGVALSGLPAECLCRPDKVKAAIRHLCCGGQESSIPGNLQTSPLQPAYSASRSSRNNALPETTRSMPCAISEGNRSCVNDPSITIILPSRLSPQTEKLRHALVQITGAHFTAVSVVHRQLNNPQRRSE